ncbi:MAG: hypothetical protein JWP91_4405 [Fibrobacteres bacterium]|nr:hypothetical protein [Fibrobacterota bacterium]
MSLKVIYTAQTGTEAIFVRNMLKDAGVEASLRTDDANGNLPFLDASEGVDVLVDESVAEDAATVMGEYERGATAIGEDEGE